METLTIEYDARNTAYKQMLNALITMGVFRVKDNFEADVARAVSGDELVRRLSVQINNMFENESTVSARS